MRWCADGSSDVLAERNGNAIWDLAVSGDGRTVVTSDSGGYMCIYQDDMRTALRFAEYTRYVSISYDGRVIAARSPNSAGEKVTRFLRAPHGQTLSVYAPLNQRLTLSGHSGLTRDGSLAALLYDDCDVHVVETADGHARGPRAIRTVRLLSPSRVLRRWQPPSFVASLVPLHHGVEV